jgi:cellulose synthase/poly-beta-1,6-N-acetylglucosamine synthase-like glycosyltransferase
MLAPGDGLPTVSVIVPVYNAVAFLEEALMSVTAQTYRGRMEVRPTTTTECLLP